MKTSVVMQRQFNGKIIRQNSKTEFLNLNDLMECFLEDNPTSSKRIDKFLDMKQTKEFAETIREAELEAKSLNTTNSGDFVLPLIESFIGSFTLEDFCDNI